MGSAVHLLSGFVKRTRRPLRKLKIDLHNSRADRPDKTFIPLATAASTCSLLRHQTATVLTFADRPSTHSTGGEAPLTGWVKFPSNRVTAPNDESQ